MNLNLLTKEYEELRVSHGDEYARNYMTTLIEVMLDDPDQPELVKDGLRSILKSFKIYEQTRQFLQSEASHGDPSRNGS